LLNIKNIRREDVEELAKLFDDLESRARQLAKGKETKLEMFEALKQYFQAIDCKIAEALGIPVDVEWLWSSAWEIMERRVKGAKEPMRPGAEITVDVRRGRLKRGRRGTTSESPLGYP